MRYIIEVDFGKELNDIEQKELLGLFYNLGLGIKSLSMISQKEENY